VITMALTTPPRRVGTSGRRTRRTTRFALACEALESRQLLSVGNTGLVAAAMPALTANQAHLAAPPSFSSFGTTGFSPGQFGTFAAANQSPIIVVVFGGLSFSFNGGSVAAPTVSTGLSSSGSDFGTLAGITGNGGNSTSGDTLTSGALSPSETISVTPLNPNVTASTNTPGGPPVQLVLVQLVPPPLPPLVVHLNASTVPATNISDSTFISILDELPPSNTHVGQGPDPETRGVVTQLVTQKVEAEPPSNSLLDFVEPYRVVVPATAQPADPTQPGAGDKAPAPAPDPANVRPLPAISDPDIEAALDFTDVRILTPSRDHAAPRPDDQVAHGNTHWSLSALFGIAAVATGGYHLVLRETDRFRGRSIPRWAGAERPTKRKTRVPSR
jgi:hypothetical protein